MRRKKSEKRKNKMSLWVKPAIDTFVEADAAVSNRNFGMKQRRMGGLTLQLS